MPSMKLVVFNFVPPSENGTVFQRGLEELQNHHLSLPTLWSMKPPVMAKHGDNLVYLDDYIDS